MSQTTNQTATIDDIIAIRRGLRTTWPWPDDFARAFALLPAMRDDDRAHLARVAASACELPRGTGLRDIAERAAAPAIRAFANDSVRELADCRSLATSGWGPLHPLVRAGAALILWLGDDALESVAALARALRVPSEHMPADA